ncbi:MAG: homocysteine S-methyltransferase family protein, partial [Myxococcales bacterium]|nr:homocysteine S-methyltransferase family protein [Myxococcales bacterium]
MTQIRDDITNRIHATLAERIMVLDGAMGTMIQRYHLGEDDYRGDLFRSHASSLKGNNELLCLTRPEVIREIHTAFLDAGADLIETNTFNANATSQGDYKTIDAVVDINLAAARIAREAVEQCESKNPGRRCFVAGAIGPTNVSLSVSPRVDDPSFRPITFDKLEAVYAEQVRALIAGGVDLLLVETSFDTLNMKSAITAIERVFTEDGVRMPVMLSGTIVDLSGRTLSGQTVDAFAVSVGHANPLTIGLNCALGGDQMRPFIRQLAKSTTTYTSCYPNAGLPNEMGEYDDTPEHMASLAKGFALEGWVNMIGGCCGTTPDHIAAIADAVRGVPPRKRPKATTNSRYCGLETLEIFPDSNFIMVGERTNVTGSRRFARLIKSQDYDEALKVARGQIEGG